MPAQAGIHLYSMNFSSRLRILDSGLRRNDRRDRLGVVPFVQDVFGLSGDRSTNNSGLRANSGHLTQSFKSFLPVFLPVGAGGENFAFDRELREAVGVGLAD